jgi:hypothetical protein
MDQPTKALRAEEIELASKPDAPPLATARTHYEPASDEQKVLDSRINRKFDLFLVGILAFDFMVQGIDRTNVGFAAASSGEYLLAIEIRLMKKTSLKTHISPRTPFQTPSPSSRSPM